MTAFSYKWRCRDALLTRQRRQWQWQCSQSCAYQRVLKLEHSNPDFTMHSGDLVVSRPQINIVVTLIIGVSVQCVIKFTLWLERANSNSICDRQPGAHKSNYHEVSLAQSNPSSPPLISLHASSPCFVSPPPLKRWRLTCF